MNNKFLTLLLLALWATQGVALAEGEVGGAVQKAVQPEVTEGENEGEKQASADVSENRTDPLSNPITKAQLLLEAGTLNLAEAVLLKNRPDPSAEYKNWITWAKTLYQLYSASEKWEQAALLFSTLPKGISVAEKKVLKTLAVVAWLKAGKGEEARKVLRALLFGGQGTPAELSHWRRLSINAFVADGLIEDARVAMIRYQLELRPDDPEWRQLHARLLLIADEPGLAAVEVASDQTFLGRFLRIIARLRNSNYTPNQAIDGLLKLEKELEEYPSLRYEVWATIAEAAKTGGNNPLRVEAIEKALNQTAPARPDQMVGVRVIDLLEGYRELAEEMGNRSGLLQGEDEAWWALSETLAPDFPLAARGIYAQLVENSESEEVKNIATAALAQSLIDSRLEPLLYRLFNTQTGVGELDLLPPSIRTDLSAQAFREGNLNRASRLIQNIEQAPDSITPAAWLLHKARLALYSGESTEAVRLVVELIKKHNEIDKPLGDRLLQIIFDLQTIERHQEAVDLIARLESRLTDPDHQREILYWKADSLSALNQYISAAEYYLSSALFLGQGYDQWGQSARYRAAEALVQAGLREDAKSLYEDLLGKTQDPRKQHQLKQRLQQLWLK